MQKHIDIHRDNGPSPHHVLWEMKISHTDDTEGSLGYLQQLILLQLNAANFLCNASLQEVTFHFLPNLSEQKTEMLTICNALSSIAMILLLSSPP